MILVILVFPVGVDFHSFFFFASSCHLFNLFLVSDVREYPNDVFLETLGDIHVLLLKHDGMLRIKTAVDENCATTYHFISSHRLED